MNLPKFFRISSVIFIICSLCLQHGLYSLSQCNCLHTVILCFCKKLSIYQPRRFPAFCFSTFHNHMPALFHPEFRQYFHRIHPVGIIDHIRIPKSPQNDFINVLVYLFLYGKGNFFLSFPSGHLSPASTSICTYSLMQKE